MTSGGTVLAGWRRAVLIALLCAGALPSAGAQTLPFHVRVSSGAQQDEKGQGLLFTRQGACYALTAGHVMLRSDRASLVAGRDGRVHGNGRLMMRFGGGDDLAILHVSGELGQTCGPELARGAALDGLVSTRSQGVLAFVLDDGGMMNLPVRLADVAQVFLRIEPTQPGDEVRQGQSGSLLKIGDVAAGMLVSAEGNVGKVLRYDRIEMLVKQYFANPAPPASQPRVADSAEAVSLPAVRNNLLAGSAGAQVVAWNLMPLSPQFNAENLLLDNAPPWLGNLQTLRASWTEIDFRLGGEGPQSLSRIELISSGVGPAPRRVRDFELLVRGSEQASWTSVQSGTSFTHDATTSVAFAPVRARYLRLRVHSNWGDSAAVGLRAVRGYAQ